MQSDETRAIEHNSQSRKSIKHRDSENSCHPQSFLSIFSPFFEVGDLPIILLVACDRSSVYLASCPKTAGMGSCSSATLTRPNSVTDAFWKAVVNERVGVRMTVHW